MLVIDSESDCYFVAAASRILFVMVVIMIKLGGLVFMQISKNYSFKKREHRFKVGGHTKLPRIKVQTFPPTLVMVRQASILVNISIAFKETTN